MSSYNPYQYFIADPHFHHGNIIKFCNRPFLSDLERDLLSMVKSNVIQSNELRISQESVDAMDTAILQAINNTVPEDGILWILGDLLFCNKDELFDKVVDLRSKINCKAINLIWGNHDNPLYDLYHGVGDYDFSKKRGSLNRTNHIRTLFKEVYEQKLISVNNKKTHLFLNHYPMRSWNRKSHDAIMLYGHVHNNFYYEDNGLVNPALIPYYESEFRAVFSKHSIEATPELLAAFGDAICALSGTDLTQDVGVDNTVREDVPWGTPWSVNDIEINISQKRSKWLKKQQFVVE